jgi:ATP-dependent Lon protease
VIQGEIDVLGTERKIQSRVRKQMESNQRDYYLNEQMKSIQHLFQYTKHLFRNFFIELDIGFKAF